jgi:hypothetical protein
MHPLGLERAHMGMFSKFQLEELNATHPLTPV